MSTTSWWRRLLRGCLPWAAWPVSAWARRTQRHFRHQARPLSLQEAAWARAVGVAEPGAIRLVRCEHMPFPAARLLDRLARVAGLPGPSATDGLTLGHMIFLRGASAVPAELLAHECRHVQQFEQAGSLDAFLRSYLAEVAAHGYHQAPMEVDARRQAALAVRGQGR